MKILKFIFIAVCLFSVTACVGGGSAKGVVDDDTRVMDEFTVPSDGTISYTGSGDLEGFSINAAVPALAGRKIYIEKKEADYSIDGYIAVSDIYAVRFTSEETSDSYAGTYYTADVVMPFSTSALSAEGGSSGDAVFCTLYGGAVTSHSSELGEGAYLTSVINFPQQYFAGYQGGSSEQPSGTIRLKGVSYADSTETITDPSGTEHPDVVRGIKFVQPGEKLILGINEAMFADDVLTHSWSLFSKPSGSSSTLTVIGDDVSLIPDNEGAYYVQLDLTGTNGATSSEKLKIVVHSYSYDPVIDDATCFAGCHDGSGAGSHKDQYGRIIMRDLVTAWTGTEHASAFTPVAAETDSSCFKCHTTGFFFADRNSDNTDEYSAANGYDDTIGNWAAPNSGDDHLKGVTCEGCHGPGTISGGSFTEQHFNNTPITSDLCLSCHDHGSISGHYFEYSDAHDKAHTLAGGNVAKNASCFKCHTGEGALSRILDAEVTPSNTENITGISCAVCHDPHNEAGNASSLRTTGNFDIALATGTMTVNAGEGLVCYNCHNTDSTLPAVGSIPHNSQAEMMQGVGGYTYDSTQTVFKSTHTFLNVTCNDCHMNNDDGVTHNMLMTENTDSRLAMCAGCHSGDDPVFTDGHYDKSGYVAPVRAKLAELKTEINSKAGLAADTTIKASYTAGSSDLATALTRAAYNYNFIMADRSNGLHNYRYAEKLIDLSMADLANY